MSMSASSPKPKTTITTIITTQPVDMSKELQHEHNHESNNNSGNFHNGGGMVQEPATPTAIATPTATPTPTPVVKSEALSTSHHSHQQQLLRHRTFPFPSSLLQERSLKRARTVALQQLAQIHVDPPAHIAGLEVPAKILGACGTCGLAEEDSSNTIVLCDGEGCGQEFHINCCTPPLLAVPKGAFYCIDCCDKGTTKQLQDYFLQHSRLKEEHEQLFLLRNSKKRKNLPVIFADALLMEDVAREKETDPASAPDSTTATATTNNKKSKQQQQQQHQRGQMGRSSNTTSAQVHDESILVPCSELALYYTDRYQELIGKPVRMYCPIGNNYHNGRIINAHKIPETSQISYLVRFPRGKDQRKTSLTLWMDLEEHSLAVATDILWVAFESKPDSDHGKKRSTNSSTSNKPTPRWTQAKLWRRNARELVPVADSLVADQYQISYRKIGTTKHQDKTHDTPTVTPSKVAPPITQWGLFESFGPPGFYQLLEFETSTQSENPLITSPRPGQPTPTGGGGLSKGEQTKNTIIQGLVTVERNEQMRVQQWEALSLDQPWHRHALQCQDEMTLGPLRYQTPMTKQCFPTTPLVEDGLDRWTLMEIVAEHLKLATPTKDLALEMVCEVVESLPATVQNIALHDVETTRWGGKL